MPVFPASKTPARRFASPRAFLAAFLLLSCALSASFAEGPSEFSTGYLDGKEFYGVSYDGDGVTPLSGYRVAFTATTFEYEGLVPAEDPGSGPYVIENGAIVIGGESPTITLIASADQYLRVEIVDEDGPVLSDWFFVQADAEAVLATSPALPKAWITVDGNFDDWSDVPLITADSNSSTVIDIVSVQYATDGQTLYFMITADADLSDFLQSTDGNGRHRTLLVGFNDQYEFGTQDGIGGWFDGDDGTSDFTAVGGDFQIEGSRLEGRVPMALIAGTVPEYLQIWSELFAWAPDDEVIYDEIERLFRIESGGPDGGVDFFGVAKFAFYTQTDSSAPQPGAEDSFEANAFVEASVPYSVVSAAFTSPDNAVYSLEREWGTWWESGEEFANQATMDGALPNGTYTFSIEMASGEIKTAPLDLTGNVYPQPPRFNDYEGLQSINSTESFTLSWDAFPGSGPDDFIVIGIDDPVADEDIFESEILSADTTSIELPVGTLQPGRSYEVWLFFAKVVDTNTEAFSEVSGLGIYASETMVQIQTATNSLSAGEWKLAGYYVPGHPNHFEGTYDIVFEDDEWYRIEGPLTAQVSAQGEISGDLSLHTQLGNHGQLLFFEPANPTVPDGYAILNRNQDVFISPWGSDATLAVKIPESAQQSDFAGTWNFAALTGGTELTKTVYNENLHTEETVVGHNMPIAQDGSQTLVDVQRNLGSADTLSLTLDASGNGGGESLLWQGDGSLSFSPVHFPLFVNASRDFTFGMGETADEQTLVIGVRAPTNAEPSWLVGQWRFNFVAIDFMGREYLDASTSQLRWVHGDDDQRRSLAGERLNSALMESGVEGELFTISQSFADEIGITPNGVIEDANSFFYLNASGDLLIRAAETEWGWEMEVGIKVSDQIHPTRTLTAVASGPGGIEAFPSENVDLSSALSAEYIHGETVVIKQEAWGGTFLGWNGDVPAGQEQAEVLVLPMDRDRYITAVFDFADPTPWEPTLDTDGDGMPDVFEQLFANRDPYLADSGSLFQSENTSGGPRFSFIVRDDFTWPWRVTHSYDLSPGSWSHLPGGVGMEIVPVSVEPPLSQVRISFPSGDEKGFLRVEIDGP